ncbi:spore cortex-lytic enzyme [Paenibacillus yonginensis]|uniref:Spore cortex-lytic enzyme n=1 Tax=Paenibacillus yonginensis TaxID=1462996 RepID=A0A1B1MY07_9BACL|nr:spore cortex-lytic enzyme [Paenibacillus yonginensis]ANS74058.1 spore cortex-lytic enzyme [Paenibacillus yonginensis]
MTNMKNWISAGLMLTLVGMVLGSLYFHKPENNVPQNGQPASELSKPAFTSQVMQVGAFGQDVYELQGRLKFLGFYKGSLDSYYGTVTRDAVYTFQKQFGMKPDGVAGDKTKLKLYNATKNWKPEASSYNPNPNHGAASGAGQSGGAGDAANGGAQESDNDSSLGSANALNLTENDLKIMANAVNGEARGEPFEGQVAVAAVILNRVKSPSFPNTVSGVIFQPGAFTAVADGQIWLTPNESSRKAVRQALNGWDPSGGCLYYFNPETATSKWIWSRPQVKTIGKHIFCM